MWLRGILGLSEDIGDREGKLLFVEENILYRWFLDNEVYYQCHVCCRRFSLAICNLLSNAVVTFGIDK